MFSASGFKSLFFDGECFSRSLVWISAVLAVLLQVQVTLFAHGNYLGLRVNSADLLLPFLGIFVLFQLFFRKKRWPQWSVAYLWGWLALLFAVMSIALVNGYFVNGVFSSWALVNKYAGFLVLLGYFLLGGWLVSNFRPSSDVIRVFCTVFCGFLTVLMALSTVLLFFEPVLGKDFVLIHNPWAGLMVNRNAYMVVAMFALVIVLTSYHHEDVALPEWVRILFWFLMPIFCLHNASRTGWIVLALFLPVFMARYPVFSLRKIVLPVVLGVGLAVFSVYGAGITSPQGQVQYKHISDLVNAPEGKKMYVGDQKRLIAVEDGMELYQTRGNPIIGAGLGSYKPFQIQKRGEFIDVIDFTALWLLVETGILGLCAFAGFFLVCAYTLWRQWRAGGDSYALIMLVFLLCFGAMSTLHELMYTRFLWFALGLALGRGKIGAGTVKAAAL